MDDPRFVFVTTLELVWWTYLFFLLYAFSYKNDYGRTNKPNIYIDLSDTLLADKPLHGIWPKYRTHGFVHWFYNLENSIPIHVHECTILENPFPINVHEYYILENPIPINGRTSLQTKITVKLNIKIWKYLPLKMCILCTFWWFSLWDDS